MTQQENDTALTPGKTVCESELLDATLPHLPRFPQQGSEHPREYREYYVEAELFEGARGRATCEDQAIAGYRQLMSITADVEFTVREIIEG